MLVVGTVGARKFFGLWGLEKNGPLEVHTTIGPDAQILYRLKWRNLPTLLFLLHCVGEYCCMGSWNHVTFFSSVGHVFVWGALVLHSYWNFSNWGPKLIWPRMDWFWSFSVRICLVSSSLYLNGLRFARFAQVFFPFFWQKDFSIISFKGILVCF